MLDVLVLCDCGWEVLSCGALAVPATMRGPLALDQIACRRHLALNMPLL